MKFWQLSGIKLYANIEFFYSQQQNILLSKHKYNNKQNFSSY